MARWDDDDEDGQFALVAPATGNADEPAASWTPCEEYGHEFSDGPQCVTCGEVRQEDG
jgi:hypothetical protein